MGELVPKIEITKEMVSAGLAAFQEWEGSGSPWPQSLAIAIFQQMCRAAVGHRAKNLNLCYFTAFFWVTFKC
jgi:hypothetical protein